MFFNKNIDLSIHLKQPSAVSRANVTDIDPAYIGVYIVNKRVMLWNISKDGEGYVKFWIFRST